jgi:radical SAM/SPASM domain protein of ACGX system
MEYFAFQWHITDTCDQRCEHCYIFSEGHPVMVDMSWERCVAVVDEAERMCERMGRIPYFYITGGDPILHPRFWDILAMLKERNIPFTLMGNPFHLTPDVCRRMKELGCRKYQLSIDGLRPTHDAIRKPGSFDATLRAIHTIRESGMHCAVMTTVSGTNIHEMPAIVDLVVEHGVDIFAFGRYCPTSEAKAHSERTHIEPLAYRDLLATLWERFERYRDRGTTFNLKDHLWTLFLYERGIFKIPAGLDADTVYDGCNCAACHFTILPTGHVQACRRFESPVGKLFASGTAKVETPLYDLFYGEAMAPYRAVEKMEKCRRCELLRFCRGCPAVAYGYRHSFYAPDPQCWKEVE